MIDLRGKGPRIELQTVLSNFEVGSTLPAIRYHSICAALNVMEAAAVSGLDGTPSVAVTCREPQPLTSAPDQKRAQKAVRILPNWDIGRRSQRTDARRCLA
jgi:hypothetical protein